MKYIHHIDYLTLRGLLKMPQREVLIQQLSELACPEFLRIGLRYYKVPTNVHEFRDSLCWGQRLMMATPHTYDHESMLYFVANYFYPGGHSPEGVQKFYPKLFNSFAKDIYPVLVRLVSLFEQTIEIEEKKLTGFVSPEMRAADIDKLKAFTDLSILQMIAEKTGCKLKDAHLEGYNTVFALLLQEKETADFARRYEQILKRHDKRT